MNFRLWNLYHHYTRSPLARINCSNGNGFLIVSSILRCVRSDLSFNQWKEIAYDLNFAVFTRMVDGAVAKFSNVNLSLPFQNNNRLSHLSHGHPTFIPRLAPITCLPSNIGHKVPAGNEGFKKVSNAFEGGGGQKVLTTIFLSSQHYLRGYLTSGTIHVFTIQSLPRDIWLVPTSDSNEIFTITSLSLNSYMPGNPTSGIN